MFALIDCNNFYASCERLFRPDLKTTPIVVLSNNDGCVIARSNEAKAIGIKMGQPFFQIKPLVHQYGVVSFSSNFTLYGDISARVMAVIESSWPEVEIYSIDEAFLDLSSLPKDQIDNFCIDLQKKILKHIGMPTSVGIGESKTLAKAANYIAKRKLNVPVFNITEQKHWLKDIEVREIWGIGRQWSKQLNNEGVFTADALSKLNPFLMKKRYNSVLMRTILELQGVPCLAIEEVQPKKSILSSKSFGQMHADFSVLAEAISSHCARASEDARKQRLVAKRLYVFIRSNCHRQDLPQYMNGLDYSLVNPTNDTRTITTAAKLCLKTLFKAGIHYKKVGIMLLDLQPDHTRQWDLFSSQNEEDLQREAKLMTVVDKINTKYGRDTLCFAAEGVNRIWKMNSEMLSPCYTTRWNELLVVR